MIKKLLVALAVCAFPAVALSATYVVPVATAKLRDRIYSTTLAFQNKSSRSVRCEAIHAIPNDPDGRVLRATYDIPAEETRVEHDALVEAGAVGTIRLTCSAELLVAVGVQTSSDGGVTFDGARVFRGVSADHRLENGARTLTATRDVLVMEVAGKAAPFRVVVKNSRGQVLGTKLYDLPPFAHQLVNLSTVLRREDSVAVDVLLLDAGGGQIVFAAPSADATLLAVVKREARSRSNASVTPMSGALPPPITPQLLLSPFKAAPFQDPATGLVYMRDRWYDASTGSFMTPDPEGHRDSANLYAFCHGDPVNCSDPTGRLGDGGDVRADFRAKEQAARAAAYAKWCREHAAECAEQQRKLANRGAGAMRMIGGGMQVVGGVSVGASTGPLPEPVTKAIAGVNIERGLENAGAGFMQLVTGEQYETPTARSVKNALVATGVPRKKAAAYARRAETAIDVVAGVAAGGASAYNAWRSAGAATNTGAFSRVISATDVDKLAPAARGTDTIVLGPYTVAGEHGVADTAATLEATAARLGGRTLANYPRDMNALAPQIQSADRIIFYTYRNLAAHPTTAAEMQLIQADPALRAKTIFVYGGLAEP